MELYSTNDLQRQPVSLKKAVMKGLPDDNGLYMPKSIDPLPESFFSDLPSLSFPEIAYRVTHHLLGDVMPKDALKQLVEEAFNFPVPLVQFNEQQYTLELFHGPSLAFKDFGARFMARLMGFFNQGEDQHLTILVATSGDTGGAVASGFYKTPGIEVIILYPSGKVSFLQEKQLTTLGHNITALEVDGTFDDCQNIVKKAFLDQNLNKHLRLSSANSINIARLIPQSLYYFEAYKQLNHSDKPVVFSIPSGNYGNLTAGLLAKRMGLPVNTFIAATNINDIVPAYLKTGRYQPRPSIRTISNAMDVGNPSNFSRMLDLYGANRDQQESSHTCDNMREDVSGYAYTDEETRKALKNVFKKYDYVMDPHGAVGYLALCDYQKQHPRSIGIILETAHPAKFIDDVENILGRKIEVPKRLNDLADQKKVAIPMSTDYEDFKNWIVSR